MEYTGIVCDVCPYSDSYKPLGQVPVKEAVTAYNHPTGKNVYFSASTSLIFGQSTGTKSPMSKPYEVIWNSC